MPLVLDGAEVRESRVMLRGSSAQMNSCDTPRGKSFRQALSVAGPARTKDLGLGAAELFSVAPF
ncbi:hypothetical protein [Roseixanthobacter pseudopolyaromaticivorans]|uniref:hypothetical protein n=1 Tax=Xanthobacteraceae TaxID=335928 RepID=UPI003726E3F4